LIQRPTACVLPPLSCHAHLLQAEYVRCSEQESVLRTLQDKRSAVAVALPGTERQLQSQSEHAKRVSKLQDRMAKLMVDLQLRDPLAEHSPEYQQGLAALRDEQLRHLQQQIEREAAALGEITQARQQMGASDAQTRSQEKKAKRRRTRIRQFVDTICAWQLQDLPASTVTEQLPEQWTEQTIKQLFSGQFPWQQTAGGAGQLPSLLVARFRDVCAEVRECLVSAVGISTALNCCYAVALRLFSPSAKRLRSPFGDASVCAERVITPVDPSPSARRMID
jgi:hypothetical protein